MRIDVQISVREPVQKIPLIKALRTVLNLGLKEAKAEAEFLMQGQTSTMTYEDKYVGISTRRMYVTQYGHLHAYLELNMMHDLPMSRSVILTPMSFVDETETPLEWK